MTFDHDLAQSCTDSVLPLVMALAAVVKIVIGPHLREMPSSWPYDDQVLAWLLPNLRDDVDRFHSRGGPSMSEMFQPHQLETIDESCVKLLGVRVERLAPGLIGELRRLATVAGYET